MRRNSKWPMTDADPAGGDDKYGIKLASKHRRQVDDPNLGGDQLSRRGPINHIKIIVTQCPLF
jgi:hypothetical protein